MKPPIGCLMTDMLSLQPSKERVVIAEILIATFVPTKSQKVLFYHRDHRAGKF